MAIDDAVGITRQADRLPGALGDLGQGLAGRGAGGGGGGRQDLRRTGRGHRRAGGLGQGLHAGAQQRGPQREASGARPDRVFCSATRRGSRPGGHTGTRSERSHDGRSAPGGAPRCPFGAGRPSTAGGCSVAVCVRWTRPGRDLPGCLTRIRVLLENVLRSCGRRHRQRGAGAGARSPGTPPAADRPEFTFMPARVLLQDFTGVPCVVDLAAMRAAVAGGAATPRSSTPGCPSTW